MLKRDKSEPLYKWIDRLCQAYGLNEEQRAMVQRVSIESYYAGSYVLPDTLEMDIRRLSYEYFRTL